MSNALRCYRCGASLESLPLPLSRRDECPSCENYLHACLMCEHFDARVPKQCREDDAEEVIDKRAANFCDYFRPGAGTFDAQRLAKEQAARGRLDALFGDGDAASESVDGALSEAEKLFK